MFFWREPASINESLSQWAFLPTKSGATWFCSAFGPYGNPIGVKNPSQLSSFWEAIWWIDVDLRYDLGKGLSMINLLHPHCWLVNGHHITILVKSHPNKNCQMRR